jgi:flagellar secretion chaperone FliS
VTKPQAGRVADDYRGVNAPLAYRSNAVLTASPEQLVVMLYDGAIRFLRQADALLDEGAFVQAVERIGRAQAIVDELLCTLNMEAGELSERRESIYVFCAGHLRDARLRKDPARVRQVARLLGELRDAWAEIS